MIISSPFILRSIKFKCLLSFAIAFFMYAGVINSTQAQNSEVDESTKANQLFDEIFEESLSRSPEFLTRLGRKEGMGKWDDLSEEFAKETLQMQRQQLLRIQDLNYDKLDESAALSYDLLKQSL